MVVRHRDFVIFLSETIVPVVDHHGFSTAHAVLARVHGRVVVQEDREEVEEALMEVPVEERWCTDSQRVLERPHQKRLKEEQ